MIERYTRPEMGRIWTEENRFQAWLEVEILACEAWAELGHIPKEDVRKIRQNANVNVARIHEIEKDTRHDVVAFTRAVAETLGSVSKWVHYGLTSTKSARNRPKTEAFPKKGPFQERDMPWLMVQYKSIVSRTSDGCYF
jgi:hypothetical protein